MKFILIIPTLILSLYTKAQIITDSVQIENIYRIFHYNTPNVKKNAALIFILHGSGGNGLQMMDYGKPLDSMASIENFITIYADGYKKYWNECRKASTAEANIININEQLFFTTMITYFYKKYCIDRKKVFVIGFSGGGHMAFKLAQTIPEKFAGICTIVANLPTVENNDCAILKKSIPVLLINSKADSVSPYNGGRMNTTGVNLGTVRSVDETFSYWAKVNASYSPLPRMSVSELVDTNHQVATSTRYYQKPLKPTTKLITIINGKHELPKLFNVFTEAWYFFETELDRRKY